MNTRLISALVLIGALLLAGCTAPAGGTWPRSGVMSPGSANPTAQPVPADTLRLTAEFERRLYVVGEPVYLTARLANTGSRPQRVIGSLDPSDGAVDIMVSLPNGEHRHFAPLGEADNDESIFVSLAPGEVLGGIVPIFFGASGWTFAEPGIYTITATYRSPTGLGQIQETGTPAVTIEVQPSVAGNSLIQDDRQVAVEAGQIPDLAIR